MRYTNRCLPLPLPYLGLGLIYFLASASQKIFGLGLSLLWPHVGSDSGTVGGYPRTFSLCLCLQKKIATKTTTK